MSTLTAAPYNYEFDDLVKVRVQASNFFGFGVLSPESGATGARIRVVPSQMAPPTEDPSCTDVTLTMNWIPLSGADAGNSPVIAYSLLWDEGNAAATTFTELTDALVTSFTVNGVDGGRTYRFKVRARNIYGHGPDSDATVVIPDDAPGKTAIPTVQLNAVDPTEVEISWPEPDDHSAPITAYEILFMKANGDFAHELTRCDGSAGSAVVAARKCSVPMGTIRTLTARPRDSLIRVKVRAFNAKGSGLFSEVNTAGATIETEPTNLSVVTIDVPSTYNDRTQVVWTALTGSARGGSNVAITHYEVYWDQAADNWVSLANTTSLFTLKDGLTGGTTYKFKVRGYNKYGEGPFTAEVSVQTSQAPEQPAAPTLQVVGAHVKISWVAPFANHRAVLGYQVLIETALGEFVERKALCDGDAQAAVLYCLVDMHDLRASPFNLVYDTLVRAKVLARNERGWSTASAPNSAGARVQVEPLAMGVTSRGAETGPTQIDVYWSPLTTPEDGGSPVLSYHLQYDNGTFATTWLDVVGLAPDSVATTIIVSSEIVSGTVYGFRVRARNIFGWGPYSTVTEIKAAREPGAPAAPVPRTDPVAGGVSI